MGAPPGFMFGLQRLHLAQTFVSTEGPRGFLHCKQGPIGVFRVRSWFTLGEFFGDSRKSRSLFLGPRERLAMLFRLRVFGTG